MRHLLILSLLAVSPALAADAPPIEDFFRYVEFRDIRISPDGKHLAATVPDENTQALVVFTREKRKVTGVARFDDEREVASFEWASSQRLAFTMNERFGSLLVEARGEPDFSKRSEIYCELQRMTAEMNTNIIPIFVPWIDGKATKVQGLVPNPLQFMGSGYWDGMWIDESAA